MASSTLLPFAARCARVFFTTRYFAPVPRTALRNSKSFSTVILLNVPTIAWLAPASSSVSFSTCSIFFAFETAIFDSFSAHSMGAPGSPIFWANWDQRSLPFRRRFHRRRINRHARPHGRTQIAALDVLALRHAGLRLDHAADYRRRILHQ